jgi:hypothetical protein
MGSIGCPQMSLRNYHYLLSNNPEQRSSRLQRVNLEVIFIMVGTDDNQLDKENFMQNKGTTNFTQ